VAIFALDEELVFPHPTLCEPDGLLAFGGSLSPERLLLAYRWGIFPWFNEGQPILWWWITPRLMIRPQQVHVSHSVRNAMNQNQFRITIDQNFEGVMRNCSSVERAGQGGGTWILPEMIDAYIELHHLGYAHSVEAYDGDKLVGGLYGLALGKIFSGESMFALKANASKVCFVHLANHLNKKGFEWIDCQQDTPHMRTFGAELIDQETFLHILRDNQAYMLSSGISF
jgi:leucyl/phenylalanyl-tRNA--protein transferase